MRFFVPRAESPQEAQHVWEATREFLASEGHATEPRKIWKVAYKVAGEPQVLKVGDPRLGEEVLVILKAADASRYFICTATHGVIEGAPDTLPNVPGDTLAVEFH